MYTQKPTLPPVVMSFVSGGNFFVVIIVIHCVVISQIQNMGVLFINARGKSRWRCPSSGCGYSLCKKTYLKFEKI